MNIKGLISNIIPTEVRAVDRTERVIKFDEAHERDANGQQTFDQNHDEKKPPMTEEQLERAIEHLRCLPATIEHKWQVNLESSEEGKFVLIRDNLGNIIRRIPEIELWSLPTDQATTKGQLLHRAA